jgi:NADH pyrophosphatase NudC (nudix superfamily)
VRRASTEVRLVDGSLDDELEDARWFAREEIHRGLAEGSFSMPNEVSISHRLIAEWLGDA